MSSNIRSTKEQALDERLQREAIESRPDFSEELHERLADAVGQFRATGVVPRARKSRRRAVAVLAAAACLVIAVTIAWQSRHVAQPGGGNGPQLAGPSIDDLPSLDNWTDRATTSVSGLVASAAIEPHAAKLKHDANLIAKTLLEPLPVKVELASDK